MAAAEAKLRGEEPEMATKAEVEASSKAIVQAALQAATLDASEPAPVAVDKKEAEKQLKAAMPGLFGKADPVKLQAAYDQAKRAGVSAAKLQAAEDALAEATRPKGGEMGQYWGAGAEGAKTAADAVASGEDSVKRRRKKKGSSQEEGEKKKSVAGKAGEMIKGTASAVSAPIVMAATKTAEGAKAIAKGPDMDEASVARRAAEARLAAPAPEP